MFNTKSIYEWSGFDYKMRRIQERMSLQKLSHEVEMSIGMLSMFENDKYNLSEYNREKLIKFWTDKEVKNEDGKIS